MSRSPIGRSSDLTRLRDEGYELSVLGADSPHLVLRHVPYVTSAREVAFGALVSTLALTDDRTIKPDTHVISFIGEHPCHSDGRPIEQIRHQEGRKEVAPGLIVDRSFSNKPAGGYPDYYDKMTSYVRIISNEAKPRDPKATAQTFTLVEVAEEESVFEYHDTNASRAQIGAISAKLASERIAIVGLGGTGSYVLDFVAKTPVREIHLFDGDQFVQRNAFRSPGAAGRDELKTTPFKVAYYKNIYSRMHRHVHAHEHCVDATNVQALDGMTFVFICIDRPSAKPAIFEHLERASVAFVDVGLGIEEVDGRLRGTLRTTLSAPGKRDHFATRVSTGDGDPDDYSTNIQIAELNALNAAFAVVRWKKRAGFYADTEREHHSQFMIEMNALVSDEREA